MKKTAAGGSERARVRSEPRRIPLGGGLGRAFRYVNAAADGPLARRADLVAAIDADGDQEVDAAELSRFFRAPTRTRSPPFWLIPDTEPRARTSHARHHFRPQSPLPLPHHFPHLAVAKRAAR